MAPSIAPELVELSRQPVPRYTSYPTAPHFTSDVTADDYAGWLKSAGQEGGAVSLYLHIPFCRTICTYCGCTTKAALRDDPVRAYAAVVHDEIALIANHLGRAPVTHIHWGGGTPNILPPDSFTALVEDLSARFDLQDWFEHAIELDPRHVTQEGARLLARLGINRASLGVQTLDPQVQAVIARIQPLERITAAFEALREAGITAINADLMYGLPRQSLGSIRETVEAVVRLKPERIAVFGYAHVPWMKPHQKLIRDEDLPGASERLAQARLARELLVDAGYCEVGIDHFALPDDALTLAARAGTLRRNFQGYTTDVAESLIGIGASSISRTPQGYAQNAPDNHGWRRAIEAGRLPVVRGRRLQPDDLTRGRVIEDLLCRFSADVPAEVAGSNLELASLPQLAAFAERGWLRIGDGQVEIQQHAPEIARIVASAFDAYLGTAGRHSAAV